MASPSSWVTEDLERKNMETWERILSKWECMEEWSQEEAAMPDRLMEWNESSEWWQKLQRQWCPATLLMLPGTRSFLERCPVSQWVFLYFIGNFGYHGTGRDGSQNSLNCCIPEDLEWATGDWRTTSLLTHPKTSAQIQLLFIFTKHLPGPVLNAGLIPRTRACSGRGILQSQIVSGRARIKP